jgi:hypothetical protein
MIFQCSHHQSEISASAKVKLPIYIQVLYSFENSAVASSAGGSKRGLFLKAPSVTSQKPILSIHSDHGELPAISDDRPLLPGFSRDRVFRILSRRLVFGRSNRTR